MKTLNPFTPLLLAVLTTLSHATPITYPNGINTKDREAVRQSFLNELVPATRVDPKWTGNLANCAAGTTSQAFRDATITQINWFRAMAGLNATIQEDAGLTKQSQAGALVLAASGTLTHTPAKTAKCYSDLGYQGANAGNLAFTLPDSINVGDTFIQDDGAGANAAVGHRAITFSASKLRGVGLALKSDGWASFVESFEIQQSSPTNPINPTAIASTDPDYTAWPPAGYVPYNVVYARWSVWSTPAGFAKFGASDMRQAQVTVLANGVPVPVKIEPVISSARLVWTINGDDGNTKTKTLNAIPDQTSDTVYDVTISNVLFNGVPRTWKYQVIGFNPTVPSNPNKSYDDLFDWAAYAYPSLTSDTNTNGSYIAGDWYYRCYGITATQPTCFGVNQATGKLNVLLQGALFDVGTAQYWLDNSDVLVQVVGTEAWNSTPMVRGNIPQLGNNDPAKGNVNTAGLVCDQRSMGRVRPDIPVVTTPYVGDGDRYALCSFVAKRGLSFTVQAGNNGDWSNDPQKITVPTNANKIIVDIRLPRICYRLIENVYVEVACRDPIANIIGPWLLK